jgi:H+/Cl- antiporter ClcA
VIGITALATLVGVLVALVALALISLVGLITHLAYTGTVGRMIVQPDTSVLGPLSLLVPVVGGLLIGVMARYGSERIRGHGIPEAMETILLRGSLMQPRLAVLKPISSAISIGTGGPFGAEGPIIVTGGAVGSLIGQFLHLTAAERRSLLVAGAAGGMTAVFGTPVAAVLLAVELLLFEWRPRSLVPAVAGAVAAQMVRSVCVDHDLLPAAPLFPVTVGAVSPEALVPGAVLVGVACAGLAWAATRAVYGAEDAFSRLPIHWAWWPAIGGLAVGVGGLIDPRVLGVGYGVIHQELLGDLAVGTLLTVLVLKLAVWAIALGSNTSGGVLAPLLILGAALGGVLGHVVPGGDPSIWAILGMAAILSGTLGSPLTSIVFAVETTHAYALLLPLLAASGVTYLLSVLLLRRSILTEKIARRGYHVNREYEVDPLHALFVRDVMTTDLTTLEPHTPVSDILAALPEGSPERRQRLYPVIDSHDRLLGVVAFSDVRRARDDTPAATASQIARVPVATHPQDTLRDVADRMVFTGHGALPVTDPDDPARLLGLITQFDLLRGHERQLLEERHRERPLSLRRPGAAAATDLVV